MYIYIISRIRNWILNFIMKFSLYKEKIDVKEEVCSVPLESIKVRSLFCFRKVQGNISLEGLVS